MSTTPRPGYARPVEYYLASGDDFALDATPYTFPQGTHPNVFSMWHTLFAIGSISFDEDFEIRLSDDLLLEARCTSATVDLTWEDGGLGSIFGFDGSGETMTQNSWITADRKPQYFWCPAHQVDDQGSISTRPKSVGVGNVSQNGVYAGTTKGSNIYWRRNRIVHELASNILETAATSEELRVRTAEWFFNGAITSNPTSDDAIQTLGFWYYPDVNDLISDVELTTTQPWIEATDIGIQFLLDSSPDTKVFCYTSPEELPGQWDGEPALPQSTWKYHFEFRFHTAPTPSGFVYTDYYVGS